jgi:hypothetical protein
MAGKKKTKDIISSATRSVKEPEIKLYVSEVEQWIATLSTVTNHSRHNVLEAILFDAWEKSLLEGKFVVEYKVNNARTKIQTRSN